jgi:hypothetical protein
LQAVRLFDRKRAAEAALSSAGYFQKCATTEEAAIIAPTTPIAL